MPSVLLVNFIPTAPIGDPVHKINTIDCFCEPEVIDLGQDFNGERITLLKHSNPVDIIIVNKEGY